MELSNSTSNDIEYTTIRYGGYGTSISWGALQIFSGSALLSHDEIDHNSKTGLIVAGSTTSPPYPSVSVDHTSVHDNGYGMYIRDGTLALSGNSAVDDNASFGIKFNIPNTTGDEPATSSVYHSEIAGNGDWGIYLGVGNLVTDYPHGQYNNIYSNAGYVNSNEGSIGDLEIAYVNWRQLGVQLLRWQRRRLVPIRAVWRSDRWLRPPVRPSFFERVPWTTASSRGSARMVLWQQCGYAEHLRISDRQLWKLNSRRPIENAL